MPFVRISIAQPRQDVREEVRRHFDELIAASSELPGFVAGYVLVSPDHSGQMGRVTIWESPEAATHAANTPRIMATHAKLHFDTDGKVQEFNMDAPVALAGPAATH